MDASTRAITPARIVALVLIVVLAAGLLFLRLGGDDSVEVPAGAKAGALTLEPCTYKTDAGAYKADCGTLVVPENRGRSGSRLIALPVTRIRARSSTPAEPIFRLEGGPGITNMDFAKASRFTDNHDLVLVGYRGVDGSELLDCSEVESALKHSTDILGAESFQAVADGFRKCAGRLVKEGIDPTSYGFVQQIDDMEAARVALKYNRIDLLSESAGTRTAIIYGERYPNSIKRSVMVGVNPPGAFLWSPQNADEQIRLYAALCAKDASCSKRTDDLVATLRDTKIADRWMLLRIKKSNVRVGSFFALMESTTGQGPLNGPAMFDARLSAADGDASGVWFMSFFGDFLFPKIFHWGQFASAGGLDHAAAREYFSTGGADGTTNVARAATTFLWSGGRLAEAWPAAPDEAEYSRVRTSDVETLLIGGDIDFSTPPQNATKDLLPHLPNGHQVVLPNFGHTNTFWNEQPQAGTRLINTFFDSGRVDESMYKPQAVDFTPEGTQTVVAKGIFGMLLGLALLAALSVLWLMPRRVRKRGGFGPKGSALLRSLYPIVIGLGGWMLGVLIVMAGLNGVSLDNQLLGVLAVGPPVGLGVYWAWVHRDWPQETKRSGLAVAVGGGLVGAWLGFHSASDLLALITAIVGAAAVSNLGLIVMDIRRARHVGREGSAGHGSVGGTTTTEPPVPADEGA